MFHTTCEFKGTAFTYPHKSSIYTDDIIYLINDDNSKAFIVGNEGDAYSNTSFVDQSLKPFPLNLCNETY